MDVLSWNFLTWLFFKKEKNKLIDCNFETVKKNLKCIFELKEHKLKASNFK